MPTCRWTNQKGVKCGQPANHGTGHGNGLLTTSRDEWHLPLTPGHAATNAGITIEPVRAGKPNVVTINCSYAFPNGLCVLPFGHKEPHKEPQHADPNY